MRNLKYVKAIVEDVKNGFYRYGLELKCLLIIPCAYFINFFRLIGMENRPTWIIGENFGYCLNDNAYCFFKYCRQKNVQAKVFFITRRKSIMNDKFLSTDENVLIYGSFRHIIYLIIAQVYIYSHTHRDLLYRKLFPLVSRNKKMVFLQHGVTGFKKFDAFYQKHCNEPDILIVVSDFEKTIIANRVGTEEEKIRITGFARYDRLQNIAHNNIHKTIAYMPTWRDWVKKYSFLDSKFYYSIMSLLKSEVLAEILSKNNIRFKLYLHKNMKDYLSFFDNNYPNIRLVEFGHENVQSMLRSADLLITDYSSVSWDFFYLGKPVLFYQFDLDEYLQLRGSYLDLKNDIFGDRVENLDCLTKLIKEYVQNDFQVKESYKAEKNKFFKYDDQQNCKRICDQIDRILN